MNEVLPCPFCGSKEIEIRDSKFWTGMSYSILSTSITHRCPSTRFTNIITSTGKTLEEAINNWNKRV